MQEQRLDGNPFNARSDRPSDKSIPSTLGNSHGHWRAIVRLLNGLNRVEGEWKFYGAQSGWQLKFTYKKKRALIYLIPRTGSFMAAMALNDKAVAALDEAKLPKKLVDQIRSEKKYPEGRPARIEVTGKTHVDLVNRLVELKLGSLA
jgi:Protein of unknown function (DUF3788)